jgi:hypothetical protein
VADNGRLGWVEVLVAINISVAALATSWASYQATLWGGVQAVQFGLAAAQRAVATRDAIDASVTRAAEIGLFTAWLEAKHTDNEELAAFYAARFPPSLRPAFKEWLAQNPLSDPRAPPSPFGLRSYKPGALVEARAAESAAVAAFEYGQRANKNANAFTRAVVILATAMFFGGVSQVFDRRALRVAMTIISLVACVGGVAAVPLLPMRTLG